MSKWAKDENRNQVIFSTSFKKQVDVEVIFDNTDKCAVVYVDGEMRDDIDLSDYDSPELVEKKLKSILKEIKNEG